MVQHCSTTGPYERILLGFTTKWSLTRSVKSCGGAILNQTLLFWKFEPFSVVISIVQVIRAFISIAFIAWNIIYFNSITMINSKIKSDALCTPLWWKNYEPNFIFQKFKPLSLIISIVLVIFCIAIMIFRPILSLWRVFI